MSGSDQKISDQKSSREIAGAGSGAGDEKALEQPSPESTLHMVVPRTLRGLVTYVLLLIGEEGRLEPEVKRVPSSLASYHQKVIRVSVAAHVRMFNIHLLPTEMLEFNPEFLRQIHCIHEYISMLLSVDVLRTDFQIFFLFVRFVHAMQARLVSFDEYNEFDEFFRNNQVFKQHPKRADLIDYLFRSCVLGQGLDSHLNLPQLAQVIRCFQSFPPRAPDLRLFMASAAQLAFAIGLADRCSAFITKKIEAGASGKEVASKVASDAVSDLDVLKQENLRLEKQLALLRGEKLEAQEKPVVLSKKAQQKARQAAAKLEAERKEIERIPGLEASLKKQMEDLRKESARAEGLSAENILLKQREVKYLDQIKTLEEERDRLKQEKADQSRDFSRKFTTQVGKISALTKEIESLRQAAEASKNKIQSLEGQLRKGRVTHTEDVKQITDQAGKISGLTKEIETLRQALEQALKEKERTERDLIKRSNGIIFKLKAQREQLHQICLSLKRRLEEGQERDAECRALLGVLGREGVPLPKGAHAWRAHIQVSATAAAPTAPATP